MWRLIIVGWGFVIAQAHDAWAEDPPAAARPEQPAPPTLRAETGPANRAEGEAPPVATPPAQAPAPTTPPSSPAAPAPPTRPSSPAQDVPLSPGLPPAPGVADAAGVGAPASEGAGETAHDTLAGSDAPTSDDSPDEVPRDLAELSYVLDQVRVSGNTKTRSWVVLRYVPFRAGQLFRPDDPRVQLTRYRLLGTGFFRDVQFSLEKGSRRGHVVLVVDVEERNTLVVNDLWMGLAADTDAQGAERPLTAFGGVDGSELNLAGSGVTLGGALALARDQLALRVRFFDPTLLRGSWMTRAELLYNDARDFFGNQGVLKEDPNREDDVQDRAVVSYKRYGGAVGFGRDLGISSQLWLQYRLETITDTRLPQAAAQIVD